MALQILTAINTSITMVAINYTVIPFPLKLIKDIKVCAIGAEVMAYLPGNRHAEKVGLRYFNCVTV